MIDSALHLRADAIRIDGRAAIDGDVDPRHRDVALVVDRRFDHRRHIGHEAAVDGEAEAMALRQLALPQPAFSVTSSTTLRNRPVSIG